MINDASHVIHTLVHEDIFGHLRHLCLKNNSTYNYIHGLDIIIRLVRWCECVRPKSNICSSKTCLTNNLSYFFYVSFFSYNLIFKLYLNPTNNKIYKPSINDQFP